MTILVVGGTGRVGSATVTTLRDAGAKVRCLSHTPEKLKTLPEGVEPAFADLDDPATIGDAFKGVSAVLLSIPVQPTEEARGLAVVEAATRAGVEKVVHISLKQYPGSDSRVFYHAKQSIETALRNAPFVTTIIRPANFFQSDSTLKAYMVDQGIFPPPIGSVGVDRIDARDVGHAAAMALITTDHDGAEPELYGPVRHTGESVAAIYTDALGRPVRYMGDDIEAWAELNAPRLGPWYVTALSGMYEQQQKHGMRRPAGVPQHPLLPSRLRTMEAYADEMAKAWL